MSDVVDQGVDRAYVSAARRLAAETGAASFTVHQVVADARGSLKGFYRHFAGKDDLLCALLAADCRDGAALLDEMVARGVGTEARVRAWIEGLFTLMTMGEASYVGVLVREHHRLSETRPDDLAAAISPLIDVLVAELAAGGDRAAARTGGWIFRMVLVTIHEVVLGRVDDRDALVEQLSRFCWGGAAAEQW